MQLYFLDEIYEILDVDSKGLTIEAFNKNLFIPYEVLNEAKSEAPLYRVLGPRGTISAIHYNEFNKTTSYGICFTRDKNYWIGDLDGVSPGVKLFQFRINQYKLANDYKIITVAEKGYQRKDQKSEAEERVLDTIKNLNRYLECVDTRKGYVEKYLNVLMSAIDKHNNNSPDDIIEKPILFNPQLLKKVEDYIMPYNLHYLEAIATILDAKTPLGINLYDALNVFQIKHNCPKYSAPTVTSNFNELESKIKEIQAKISNQSTDSSYQESPLLSVFKDNIRDYKKKLKSMGYEVHKITDLNYSLNKELPLGVNFSKHDIFFQSIITPSDILVTLMCFSLNDADIVLNKLKPLYNCSQKSSSSSVIYFTIPVDIKNFNEIQMSLELLEQVLRDELPFFHNKVLENGFKFNDAKKTYTRRLPLITISIKIENTYPIFEIKFSTKIFAPKSAFIQKLKEELASKYYLYSKGNHLGLKDFPKNFDSLMMDIELLSQKLDDSKKRYEQHEAMFTLIVDKIKDIGFHDYSHDLSFEFTSSTVESYINIDPEFWFLDINIIPDYTLKKQGIIMHNLSFVKNSPLFTKIKFHENYANLRIEFNNSLSDNLDHLKTLLSKFNFDSDDSKTSQFDIEKEILDAGYKEESLNTYTQESELTETTISIEDSVIEIYLQFKSVLLEDSTDKNLAFNSFKTLTNQYKHDIKDNGIIFHLSDNALAVKSVVHTINYFNQALSKVIKKKPEEIPPEETIDTKEVSTNTIDTFKNKILSILNNYDFTISESKSGVVTFSKILKSIEVKGTLFAKNNKIEFKLPKDNPTTIGIIKQITTFDGVKHVGYVDDYEVLYVSKSEIFEEVIKIILNQSKMRKGDLINKVYDLKFKKTGDEDHDDAIDRILAYIKKNQKVLKSRADLGVLLLDTPKELSKYKLEYPAVMLMFYEDDKYDIKKDPIFLKFYKSKALSIVRQPFKTKDLNGNPCIGVVFYDAKTVSKYKIKLIQEAKESNSFVIIDNIKCKIININESLVTLESSYGIQFTSDYKFLDILVDTSLEK